MMMNNMMINNMANMMAEDTGVFELRNPVVSGMHRKGMRNNAPRSPPFHAASVANAAHVAYGTTWQVQ